MSNEKNALPVKSCYKAYYSIRKEGTYEKPVYLENMTEYSSEKDVSQDPWYAEGTLKYNSNTLKEIPFTMAVGDLTAKNECDLLGHKLSNEGGIVRTDNDIPPEVAVIVSDKKADGKIAATIYYSGQFAPSGRSAATSEGSSNYQNKTITATFKPTDVEGWKGITDYEFTLENEEEFEAFVSTLKIPTKKVEG